MDKNEQTLINDVLSKNISEEDRMAAIDTLEVLLSLDALPKLVSLLADKSFSYDNRKRAARAIAVIGCADVQKELHRLRSMASSDLIALLDIAERGTLN